MLPMSYLLPPGSYDQPFARFVKVRWRDYCSRVSAVRITRVLQDRSNPHSCICYDNKKKQAIQKRGCAAACAGEAAFA
jgi:hypothetical protein